MTTGVDVRTSLLRSAGTLFAERGLDAVSLREIHAASGTRNASAIQYHFGGRAGMLRALLEEHAGDVLTRGDALLDQYEAAGVDDLRTLVGALVRPLAATLDEPGGAGYLQVLADLLNSPSPVVEVPELVARSGAFVRWRALVEPLLDPAAVAHHRRFTALRFTVTELARRARLEDRSDHRLFTSDLVDLVTGLLEAPVSDETRRAEPPSRSARRASRRRAR